MPSVWTQTPWSWLQDLAKIGALGGERSLAELERASKDEPEKSWFANTSIVSPNPLLYVNVRYFLTFFRSLVF